MSVAVCGSLAYDVVMVFNDRFKNHILPDKVHMLSVSFVVSELRQNFGGCAGNIAFNLKLLGGEGVPRGTVGKDFNDYAMWLDDHGISRAMIKIMDEEYTARAFITSDLDDNQINAFHPGAMELAHDNDRLWPEETEIAIVAPDGGEAMIQHATFFAANKIPFMFDPGQAITRFNGDQLNEFVDHASWLACNDYEAELLSRRTEHSVDELSERVEALVITKGAQGSVIYVNGEQIKIPVAPISEARDPTGCGDAYRAGLLYGLERKLDWSTTGRIASLLGAYAVEEHGMQNHFFNQDEFAQRFEKSFGSKIEIS
ncbi:MAG: carbohydrate kinase family protein [Gammaproteobacteria bacterium]|nr:carbohydrate kinase family protein [Gammaproteobacteria bacterium]